MTPRQLLTWRTGAWLFCLAAIAPIHAGQQPATPDAADQPSGLNPQFPRTPNANQFPRPQLNGQVPSIPEVGQFPPFNTWTFESAPQVALTKRAEAPRVVCGMVVVPGNADLDRKILRELPANAPKGVIRSVEGTCEPPVAVNVVPVPGTPSPVR